MTTLMAKNVKLKDVLKVFRIFCISLLSKAFFIELELKMLIVSDGRTDLRTDGPTDRVNYRNRFVVKTQLLKFSFLGLKFYIGSFGI